MTCGSVADFYESSDCIRALFDPIERCNIYNMLPNIPFYGAVFSSGAPRLSALMSSIRQRVGIDAPPAGAMLPTTLFTRIFLFVFCPSCNFRHRGAMVRRLRFAHQRQLRPCISLPKTKRQNGGRAECAHFARLGGCGAR